MAIACRWMLHSDGKAFFPPLQKKKKVYLSALWSLTSSSGVALPQLHSSLCARPPPEQAAASGHTNWRAPKTQHGYTPAASSQALTAVEGFYPNAKNALRLKHFWLYNQLKAKVKQKRIFNPLEPVPHKCGLLVGGPWGRVLALVQKELCQEHVPLECRILRSIPLVDKTKSLNTQEWSLTGGRYLRNQRYNSFSSMSTNNGNIHTCWIQALK